MTDALTIGDARDTVLDHLDDPRGVRFNKAGDYVRIDRKLRSAQSSCLEDYVVEGGDRFDEAVSVDTSADDGTAQLAAYDPLHVRAVLLQPDDTDPSTLVPLDEGDRTVRGSPDTSARTLSVIIIRRFAIPNPADASDLLMGTVAGAARSWAGFDEWVCAVAAKELGTKDMEGSSRMGELVAEKRESVLRHVRTPRSEPWPSRRASSWPLRRMKWIWMPMPRTVSLVFDSTSSAGAW